MTRADFTYMVVDALGCEINNGNSFADVSRVSTIRELLLQQKILDLLQLLKVTISTQKNLLQQNFLKSVIDKALKYKKSNADFKGYLCFSKGQGIK